MKRPWTPGPWTIVGLPMFVEGYDMSKVDTLQWRANKLLASKSPEMAELLIEFCDEIDIRNDYSTFVKLAYRAKDLLKEIGHEATT